MINCHFSGENARIEMISGNFDNDFAGPGPGGRWCYFISFAGRNGQYARPNAVRKCSGQYARGWCNNGKCGQIKVVIGILGTS